MPSKEGRRILYKTVTSMYKINMKSLTIVSTYSPRYFPLPVTKSLETTAKNWPSHAKILVYPDNMSQTLPAGKEINEEGDRFEYYNLCKEQPSLQNFIDRHSNNPKLQKLGMKDYEFEYDAIRFSYKVFACIDAYQKTKPDIITPKIKELGEEFSEEIYQTP